MSLTPLLQTVLRRPGATVLVLAGLTAILAPGLARLRFETGILDWLPKGHPNVEAFAELVERLPGAVNQELIWLELDPQKAARGGVARVTDHEALLAQAELLEYVRSRVPAVSGAFGLVPWLEAIDATLSESEPEPDGDGAAGSFLRSPRDSEKLLDLFRLAAGNAGEAFLSSDGRGTILALAIDAPPFSAEARSVGKSIAAVLGEYASDSSVRRDLFRGEYLVPAGASSGVAGIDASLRRDVLRFTPLAALILLGMLALSLRSARRVGLLLGLLAVGVLWTFGLVGWTRGAVNIVTVALIPLLLGCGIDYGIILSVDLFRRQAAGQPETAIIESVARGPCIAVLVTAATTVAGLGTLALSDSPGIRALGIEAAFGMACLAALSVAALPGLTLALARKRTPAIAAATPRPAPAAALTLLEFLLRNPGRTFFAFGLLVLAAVIVGQEPSLLLDPVQGNYPPDAPLARAVRRMREQCGGAFPEILIARGDLSSPRSVELLRRIEDRVESSAVLGGRFRPVGLPDVLAVRDFVGGSPVARLAASLGTELPPALRDGGLLKVARSFAPSTPEGIAESVKRLSAHPSWGQITRLVVAPDLSTGTVLLLGGDAGIDMASVGEVWRELETIVSEEARPDDPVRISFLGFRTMAYLFAQDSRAWLRRAGAVSLVTVLVLSALVLRSRHFVVALGALMVSTTIIWFALLKIAGIHVSIFLLFPLVFALCIGSDYALHILLRLRREPGEGSMAATLAPTAWAVTLAAATDAGVFLSYSGMEIVSASEVMISVALAVASVYACTALLLAWAVRGGGPPGTLGSRAPVHRGNPAP